ncbi:beta-ketoacyl synthase N-terminal-like domain-containing protein [Hyalangium versicolor]|uniref:beta-ketoacyl synthase N-terminal-like domain-containing protein n=1 Tax=Hyalangium versicolor TaxID=2861190 RepID=UPI001CCE456C|nr:beta-ketoacyl synthase N-terminal-like domain-containing protein [Hyalangium versicolor]
MAGPAQWREQGNAVAIVGTGAFNGLAFNAAQSWAFWRAEATGVVESPFRCANGFRATMVLARTLSPRAVGVERMEALALGALEELVPALGAGGGGGPRALWLGLPERYGEGAGREHVAERRRLEQSVQAWCNRHAGKMPVNLVPRGHASLAWALEAFSEVASGRLEAAIVGGVDTYYAPEVVDELLTQERLFDGDNLDSFIPGEGAAFLVLMRPRVAQRQGLPVLARVEAVATGFEPGAMFSEQSCTGNGLAQAVRGAVQGLPASGRRLEWLLGDLTNENYRAQEFQLALPRGVAPGGLDSAGKDYQPIAADEVQADFLPLRFGDLGAATLPTAAIIAAHTYMRDPPVTRTCLLMGSSVGPHRGAMLMAPV